ncbi:MAG: protoporphyrinogen oxidase [Deltaproteobacteria bacterium]|nr:protoporphyrinogen oxidase [Deltaproteobacteria bacterium]
MSRVLVLFASSHGQTRAIAGAIAARLRERGHVAEVADAGTGLAHLPPPEDYDAAILGSRVEYGDHARSILAYVARHRERLAAMPTAFFSVSMAASEPGPDPAGYLARFTAATRWKPGRVIAIAGALRYTSYRLVTRVTMKLIAWRKHRPTDTSRDHVFTDWSVVTRFADDVVGDLRDVATPLPVAPPS